METDVAFEERETLKDTQVVEYPLTRIIRFTSKKARKLDNSNFEKKEEYFQKV